MNTGATSIAQSTATTTSREARKARFGCGRNTCNPAHPTVRVCAQSCVGCQHNARRGSRGGGHKSQTLQELTHSGFREEK